MACGCSSYPTYTQTVTSSGCATGTSGSNCPMPRRVASPSVSPVKWKGAERLLQKPTGKLMAAQCDGEVNVLDSPIDGAILFNAETGNVYVGQIIADYLPDNFACATTAVYGFPVYGASPGCRDLGENPDRPTAIIRPAASSTGKLYAHNRSCCCAPGLEAEMTPVEIIPATMPEQVPADMRTLCYVKRVGTDCNTDAFDWYEGTGNDPVAEANINNFEFPDRPLTETDDLNFGLAVWVKDPTGSWSLQKASNEIFQDYIDQSFYAGSWLSPRVIIASQASPIPYDYNFIVDLRTMPNYSPQAKEVYLYVQSAMSSPVADGAVWSFEITVNGVSKYRTSGGPTAASELSSSAIIAPIPDNKILNIEFLKVIYFAGTQYPYNASEAQVFLEAFK